jgi:acetylglutamate kinase
MMDSNAHMAGGLHESGEDRPQGEAHASEREPSAGEEPDAVGAILVKIGGSTLGGNDTTLRDVVALQKQGVRQVVVHGGGKIISEWMVRQGVRPTFSGGLRVTDEPSLEIVVAVLTGIVNKSLVASINAMGGRAIGLSGVDGGMLKAEIKDPDLGLVGQVVEVDPRPIEAVMAAGFVPIIAPVAVRGPAPYPESESMLNVNADTVAGEIAAAIGAERLVMLTDVEGVLDSSRRLIPRLTRRQAEGLMDSKVIDGGMVPKIGACLKALETVQSTQIVDGRLPNALMDAVAGKAMGTRLD